MARAGLLGWVVLLAGCLTGTVPSSSGPGATSSGDGVDPMPSPSPNAPAPPTSDPTPTPTPTAAAVRIAAGATAAYTDPSGHVWAADNGFSGGVTDSSATPVAIAGTDSAPLYNSERYGSAASFGYTLAVPNGAYDVHLGFAELYVTAAGQRLFDVSINGAKVLTAFDIFAAAGAMDSAVVRSFPVTVTNGQLVLELDPGSAQNPKINTIEVVPATSSDGGT